MFGSIVTEVCICTTVPYLVSVCVCVWGGGGGELYLESEVVIGKARLTGVAV